MADRRSDGWRVKPSTGQVVLITIGLVVVIYSLVAPRQGEPQRSLDPEDQLVTSWCGGCQIELVTTEDEKDGAQTRRYIVDTNAVFLIPQRVGIGIVEGSSVSMQTMQDGRQRLTGVSRVEFTFSYPLPTPSS